MKQIGLALLISHSIALFGMDQEMSWLLPVNWQFFTPGYANVITQHGLLQQIIYIMEHAEKKILTVKRLDAFYMITQIDSFKTKACELLKHLNKSEGACEACGFVHDDQLKILTQNFLNEYRFQETLFKQRIDDIQEQVAPINHDDVLDKFNNLSMT